MAERTFPSGGLSPIDSYVVDPGTRNAGYFQTVIETNTSTSPIVVQVDLTIGANVSSPTAFHIYVKPNSGGVDPTIATLTGIGLYMDDIANATVDHLIGIDIGLNSANLADNWHTFFRLKGHSGTAKSLFVINAAADFLFDFQGADTAVPLSGDYTTLACRMPDGATKTLALS